MKEQRGFTLIEHYNEHCGESLGRLPVPDCK
jgi:hypothetical protein